MSDEKDEHQSTYYGGVEYGEVVGGGSGADRLALDRLESSVYDARSSDNARAERERLKRVRAATERKDNERREALQRERDSEARENSERLKEELRTKYLATGNMTSAEFEKEWPRIKKEHLDEQVRERERAFERDAHSGIYGSIL